jgi:hypothetical protein
VDPLSAPGGFLGGFVLVGIILPVVASFLGDGIVFLLRGRGPLMLFFSAALSLGTLGLASVAMQNADHVGESTDVSGAIGLILCFSVPVALVGFGLRMLSLHLNPASRGADMAAIGARIARENARREARANHAKRPKVAAHI